MKTQKEIIQNLNDYRLVMIDHAKNARKRYYLETRRFYRDLRFDEFLEYRSKLYLLENILGIENSNIQIVIYA